MSAYCRLGGGLLAALLLSCGGQADGGETSPRPIEPRDVRESGGLHLDFERSLYRAGDRLFDAGPGWADAAVVESQPRVLEVVAGAAGVGRAVSFPPRCSDASCLRALVELPDDDRLDPGDKDFAFGARVRLAADQTDLGSNVVQKGRYETSGGQWKLQVDGADGRPSCVLQGNLAGKRESAKLEADQSITDDNWHSVTCHLSDDTLTLTVDESLKTMVAEVGVIENDEPVRVGASGYKTSDDQFHGDIDDVHFCAGECAASAPLL